MSSLLVIFLDEKKLDFERKRNFKTYYTHFLFVLSSNKVLRIQIYNKTSGKLYPLQSENIFFLSTFIINHLWNDDPSIVYIIKKRSLKLKPSLKGKAAVHTTKYILQIIKKFFRKTNEWIIFFLFRNNNKEDPKLNPLFLRHYKLALI